MTELPQKFKDRMKEQLGAEYEPFLSCYEQEGYAGLRVNTGKISPADFQKLSGFSLTSVPWTENGFYYDKNEPVTKHPYYYAGLYYIQEPSAMLPASRLPIESGDKVLDLCAAPGGKATELASKLGQTGLLVANDASASRAKALLKNLSVWGCPNCCITGETPSKLLAAFGCYFDKILVDAPCSGEGMFRKDAGLIASWEERGPEEYARIQLEILDCAVQMLRPDGMLLYSTCTFSKAEDEDVISQILEQYPELELVQPAQTEGLSRGYAPCEKAIRVWPHKVKGEGHFLALLHKKSDGRNQKSECIKQRAAADSQKKMPEEVRTFLKDIPEAIWKDRIYREIDEQCLLLPAEVSLPSRLRYLRTGLLLGTRKKGRFEPSQPLAMVLDAASYPSVLNLSAQDERVIRYLKGETINLLSDETLQKGWVLICVDGFALGWGKTAGQSIKNKYYPGWRLQ